MSKVTLWSGCGNLRDRQVRPNAAVEIGGVRRLDVTGIADWLVTALAAYAGHGIEYLVPVGHGAGVAAIVDGALAFAPLDYEQPLPSDVMAAYRTQRDPFALSGSPALAGGLNMGAQLFWLERLYPQTMSRAALLPWAQYWAWFLSGEPVSEVTSLGCHSDLWLPAERTFSPMAKRLGWAERFAPLAGAGQSIGAVRADLAERTGLPATAKVLTGLHDSNAALLAARGFAEIADNEATVLSTGTWFVAMRLPAVPVDLPALPGGRDCLVNVDPWGRPVPSARFMGGREIETVIGIDTRRVDIKPDQPALVAAVPEVLERCTMLLPSLAQGFGPFPAAKAKWLGEPENWYQRRAAACLYAALVTDCSLGLIGSQERVLVEGRFAEAEVFVRALASLRPGAQVFTANAHNDVSFGALRLIDPELRPEGTLRRIEPLDADIGAYRARWLAEIGEAA